MRITEKRLRALIREMVSYDDEAELFIPSEMAEDYAATPPWDNDDAWVEAIRDCLSDATDHDIEVHGGNQGIGSYEYWGFKEYDSRPGIDEIVGDPVEVVLNFVPQGDVPQELFRRIINKAVKTVPVVEDTKTLEDESSIPVYWHPGEVRSLGGTDEGGLRFAVTFEVSDRR